MIYLFVADIFLMGMIIGSYWFEENLIERGVFRLDEITY